MKTRLQFTKIEGAGNDFVVIDDRDGVFPVPESNMVLELCARKKSVGADGVILLQKSNSADFKMRIFNPDGGEPEMCGNGARCIARFAYVNRIAPEKMKIETRAGVLEANILGENVRVLMSNPSDFRKDINVSLPERTLTVDFINTGVPHVVIFVDDIEKTDVASIGKAIRYASEFSPAGTNVNFVCVTGKKEIKVRTYERGVEGETLACGTGMVASCILAGELKGVVSPVKAVAESGDEIIVEYGKESGSFEKVYMTGPARIIYTGELF